jgi:photosystem II stability/assembly factor-like uncharacterized protein
MFRLKFAARRNQQRLFAPSPVRMRAMRSFVLSLFCLLFGASVQAQWWRVQTSGLDTNLRGVSATAITDPKGIPITVVWASGSKGVILRSLDEGETWVRLQVPDGDALDFRGIVAFNAATAYVMSSGEGEKSRIYKTTDGGKTWNLQYTDKRKEFFLDSIACLSEKRCFALGDPIDGKFLLLNTTDGEHWNVLPSDQLPAALPGEGAFAASNSCLAIFNEEIYFGTGGPTARVFHSADLGRTWTVVETPLAHANASSGIFSISRRQSGGAITVVVVGGDYQAPKRASTVAALSEDGGKTWKLSKRQPGGFRSAAASLGNPTFVTVGPNGEEISEDRGVHWKRTDSLNLNALAILDDQRAWAVGPQGTIARFISKNPVYRKYHQ